MRSSPQRSGLAALLPAALLLLVACIPNEASTDEATIDPAVPSGTVAIPAQRLTPFCQALIDLSERLETDPPDDPEALILETYLEVADDVPAEIADDFGAVLAGLQGRPLPTVAPDSVPPSSPGADSTDPPATDPAVTDPPVTDPPVTDPAVTDPADGSVLPPADAGFDEGRFNSDTPSQRLNDYVTFVCRDSDNNPGPAATQPLDDIAPATSDG